MQGISQPTADYNPAGIVNNPPHITNLPFYEYLRDNKLDFDTTDLKMAKIANKNEQKSSTFMSVLFWLTAIGAVLGIYAGRNKIKKGYNSAVEYCKDTWNSWTKKSVKPKKKSFKEKCREFWHWAKQECTDIKNSILEKFKKK